MSTQNSPQMDPNYHIKQQHTDRQTDRQTDYRTWGMALVLQNQVSVCSTKVLLISISVQFCLDVRMMNMMVDMVRTMVLFQRNLHIHTNTQNDHNLLYRSYLNSALFPPFLSYPSIEAVKKFPVSRTRQGTMNALALGTKQTLHRNLPLFSGVSPSTASVHASSPRTSRSPPVVS